MPWSCMAIHGGLHTWFENWFSVCRSSISPEIYWNELFNQVDDLFGEWSTSHSSIFHCSYTYIPHFEFVLVSRAILDLTIHNCRWSKNYPPAEPCTSPRWFILCSYSLPSSFWADVLNSSRVFMNKMTIQILECDSRNAQATTYERREIRY
jgi:hypothetical protein